MLPNEHAVISTAEWLWILKLNIINTTLSSTTVDTNNTQYCIWAKYCWNTILHWVMYNWMTSKRDQSTQLQPNSIKGYFWYCWFICLLYIIEILKIHWELRTTGRNRVLPRSKLNSTLPNTNITGKVQADHHKISLQASPCSFEYFECLRSRGLPKVSRKI